MSIAIIGTICSYLLPFANKIFGLWERKETAKIQRETDALDHAREIELGKIQLDIAKAKGDSEVRAVDRKASSEEFVAANRSYRAEGKEVQSGWVSDIRGLVRPVVTLAVTAVFCWKEALGFPISDTFAAITAVVIGFWFAGRDILRLGAAIGSKGAGGWQRLRKALS